MNLSVRIGIASGLCVVGNLRHLEKNTENSDTRRNMDNQITALGNPPNLASRLQTLVPSNSVAVSNETRLLAGNLFDFEDFGLHKIKGFSGETRVWRVIGESKERSRFLALRPESKTPLVGRKKEIRVISGLWKEACDGNGQYIYLSGEPGIGKSRLVSNIAENIVGSDHSQWWFHCNEHLQGSAFAPVIAHVQALLGISRTDDIHESLEKMSAHYTNLSADELYLLAELLLIEQAWKNAIPKISNPKRREKLYNLLIKLIEEECLRTPLLMIIEDAHWIDPSTQELLQYLSEPLTNLPLLLIITSRDIKSNANPIMNLSHVHKINIEQLQHIESFALLDSLWNEKKLPEFLAKK